MTIARRLFAGLAVLTFAFSSVGCGDSVIKNEQEATAASKLTAANEDSKYIYNVVSEYVTEQQIAGVSYQTIMAEVQKIGQFEIGKNYGNELIKLVNSGVAGTVSGGTVYISVYNGDTYFVQWKESADSEIIGQYPDPISEDDIGKVKWGMHFGNS